MNTLRTPATPTLRPVRNIAISPKDLSTLLMATLLLATGAHPTKQERLAFMTAWTHVVTVTQSQLLSGRETIQNTQEPQL